MLFDILPPAINSVSAFKNYGNFKCSFVEVVACFIMLEQCGASVLNKTSFVFPSYTCEVVRLKEMKVSSLRQAQNSQNLAYQVIFLTIHYLLLYI